MPLQGYGEENDWSLRARQLGWQHVAATGVFVGHIGGQSFGLARRHLLARNLAVLNRLHPGYDDLVAAFFLADPLAVPRRAADALAWAAGRNSSGRNWRGAVILITRNDGGGVARFVGERCATLRSEGWRPVVLRPAAIRQGAAGVGLSEAIAAEFPNLRFALPAEFDELLHLLRAENPREVEIHHLLGHAPEVLNLMERLGIPYRVYVHDYALWCPRITLGTNGARYCGEPLDPSICTAGVADCGQRLADAPPVVQHRANSAHLLDGAETVVVSCDDVAARVSRHFRGVQPMIMPWEHETVLTAAVRLPRPKLGPQIPWRVLVVGAIGAEKGYDVLLGCVRDAARRRLNLSFIVAGYTMDDSRLLDSGPVFITGAFEEAVTLARAQHAHLGFVPSIRPEIWCYSLSTLWLAGLEVAAFAFGAQGERITRSGLGLLLPLGVPPERINDMLLQYVTKIA
jgi:glycosyltransferase involved in cell wall biosynthesis